MVAVIGEQHEVRILPQGSVYYALCSCGWEYHAKDRIEAALESDLHANPLRGDGSGREWTGRPPLSIGRKLNRRKP